MNTRAQLFVVLIIIAAAAVFAQDPPPFAYRIQAELQTQPNRLPQSLTDLVWQQGTTPLIALQPLNRGRPVAADSNVVVRMIIGQSPTGTHYAVVTNQTAIGNYYAIQWPTIGTNTAGEAWWYTVYYEVDGLRYWSGDGDLYIEATTSTAQDGLVWQEFTTPNVGWANIVGGDPSVNTALVAYVQSEASGLPDAPADGPIYGRQSNKWVSVESAAVPAWVQSNQGDVSLSGFGGYSNLLDSNAVGTAAFADASDFADSEIYQRTGGAFRVFADSGRGEINAMDGVDIEASDGVVIKTSHATGLSIQSTDNDDVSPSLNLLAEGGARRGSITLTDEGIVFSYEAWSVTNNVMMKIFPDGDRSNIDADSMSLSGNLAVNGIISGNGSGLRNLNERAWIPVTATNANFVLDLTAGGALSITLQANVTNITATTSGTNYASFVQTRWTAPTNSVAWGFAKWLGDAPSGNATNYVVSFFIQNSRVTGAVIDEY